MKKSKIAFMVIFALLFLLCWSLFETISLAQENNRLKVKLDNMSSFTTDIQLQLSALQSQNNDYQSTPSITYCTYEFDKRLVTDQLIVHLYPSDNAPKIPRTIEPYTVVNVLDSGLLETEGRELWLYVTFPVYDTPMDNKGWIKEMDTVALTEENKVLVKSNIDLKKGTPIYEVDIIDNIQSSKSTELSDDVTGRIERDDRGYIYIQCGGGWSFWVEKKYIIYPTVN